MTTVLSPENLQLALAKLPAWSLQDGKLHRIYTFSDFIEAFAFMSRVAPIAEALHHHPEWTNVYNEVSIFLSTHDTNGITEKDIALAEKMEMEAEKRNVV
jgi:4a-hydroxytetrahydrobiopterin dehydratase